MIPKFSLDILIFRSEKVALFSLFIRCYISFRNELCIFEMEGLLCDTLLIFFRL